MPTFLASECVTFRKTSEPFGGLSNMNCFLFSVLFCKGYVLVFC